MYFTSFVNNYAVKKVCEAEQRTSWNNFQRKKMCLQVNSF